MIAQQIFNGLTIGMTYALIAVGYSLVFGILRLVNFSHGSVYAFGANITLVLISLNLGLPTAIILSIILTGILSILVDKAALKPLREKNAQGIAALITTIGVSSVISNLLIAFLGSQKRSFPNIFPEGSWVIEDMQITYAQGGMFIISLVLMLILMLIIYKTKIGLAMRASEQNIKSAKLMGINVNFVVASTFFIGGLSASLAGTLISSYYGMVYPNMGYTVGLKAFSAAVLGGIGVLPGALLGGLVVGITETLAATILGSEFRDSMAFIILIVVLIIRPNGFFGKKGIKKV